MFLLKLVDNIAFALSLQKNVLPQRQLGAVRGCLDCP
jgi:hypothetical protein